MIESIKNVRKIEGHVIAHHKMVNTPPDTSKNITINHKCDTLNIRMMTKPVSEGGEGCQVTVLIRMAIAMITYFNEKFPCDENHDTLLYLKMAIDMQEKRTKNRIKRGVEGKNVK